jgi:hypothetical protein
VAGRAGQLVNTEAAAARQGARTIAGSSRPPAAPSGPCTPTSRPSPRASADIDAQGRALLASVAGLASGVEQSGANLRTAGGQLGTLRDGAEALIGLVADAGVETPDTRFIHAVQAAAAEVARRFEAGLARGDVTADALFDRDYRPVPGSDPPQVLTHYLEFTDRVLPGVQEAMLALDPRVVFCAAVDVNGYLPTHNRKYSKPQRPDDPTWNAANCRKPAHLRRPSGRRGRAQPAAVPPPDLPARHGRRALRADEGPVGTHRRARPALGRAPAGYAVEGERTRRAGSGRRAERACASRTGAPAPSTATR